MDNAFFSTEEIPLPASIILYLVAIIVISSLRRKKYL